LAELPFPAVNQDHIRDLALFNRFTIATTQHLIHGRIVIARRDAGDVIAAILGAQRPLASNTTQDATVCSPIVWLMSKHSIRFTSGSFSSVASAVKRWLTVDCCDSFVVSAVAALVRASFR
jgi:hypothetical protein